MECKKKFFSNQNPCQNYLLSTNQTFYAMNVVFFSRSTVPVKNWVKIALLVSPILIKIAQANQSQGDLGYSGI